MIALYLPFNIFSLLEELKVTFKEKEKIAIKEYLDYLKSQVNLLQTLVKEKKCDIIENIDIEETLNKIDNTKTEIKKQLKKEKDKEVSYLLDEIYTYLLKYEFSLSQLWACYENS